MGRKKTHEEYVAELKEKAPNIEVVDKYINATTKIMHHCLIHDINWMATPHEVLTKLRCPKCGMEVYSLKRRKTHEQYIKEVAVKNPTVEVVGRYINAKTKITHHCLIHDVYWDTSPFRILEGCGCPKCHVERFHETRTKTNDEYIDDLKNISPYVIPLEEYITCTIPILHRCTKHNVEWKTIPYNILKLGCGCPECGNEKIREKLIKSHEEYIKEVSSINPDVIVLGEYLGSNIPILHKCKKDGYEWMVSPASILSGNGCPVCFESKGERKVRQLLEGNKIVYYFQKTFDKCKDIKQLPFDFYLPEYNVCIEYQGEQHYKPIDYFGGEEKFEIQQKHDQIKRDYCKKNNIKLLEIRYDEDIEEKLNNFLFI